MWRPRFEIADRNAWCGRNIADADRSATASGRNCGVNSNHTWCGNETATQQCFSATQRRIDRNRKRCLRKQRSQINFTKEKEKNNLFSSFQSVYFAVYEGMLLFLSLVLLRCDLLDEQLKIWRKEEDEILLFGSLVWLSLVSGFHWFGFETLCAFWSIFGVWVVNGKRNRNWVGCLLFEAPCESTTSF
jgi:hypothetical protein